jgi:uncharacterized membrane protein
MKRNRGIVHRVVPALVAWAVTKALEAPKLRASVRSIDRDIDDRRRRARSAVQRAVRDAGRNAVSNGVWLAAGVVAFAAGIALIARATRPK